MSEPRQAVIHPAIAKGSIFNIVIAANTDLFDADMAPTVSPTTFRIYACLSVGGNLIVRRTSGAVTVSEQLNAVALTADVAYIFDFLVESGETINIQYSIIATIRALKVVEIPGVI